MLKNLYKVGIEAVSTKYGGGARILTEVARGLCDHPRISEVVAFCAPEGKRRFDFPSRNELSLRPRPSEDSSYLRRLLWFRSRAGQKALEENIDVILFLNGMGVAVENMPAVTMVQQSLVFSEEALATTTVLQRLQMRIVKHLMKRSCQEAVRVVVQSFRMRQVVHAHYGVREADIMVCYPEINTPRGFVPAALREAPANSRTGATLLYVGSDAPYKNLDRIARSIKRIRSALGKVRLRCTLEPGHPIFTFEGVEPLGYLGQEDLYEAYEECDVVVQPSLIESGPLVPVEAMSLNRPLLVADRPWARDACQTAALYFDPLDENDFVEKAVLILQDVGLRQQLVAKGSALVASRRMRNDIAQLANELIAIADGFAGLSRQRTSHR